MEHGIGIYTFTLEFGTDWFVQVFVWFIVQLHNETKRLEILLNRTREEMNRDFVSKEDLHKDMERMMDSLENINKKIDDFLLSNQK